MVHRSVQAERQAGFLESPRIVDRALGAHRIGPQAAECGFARRTVCDSQTPFRLGEQAGILDVDIDVEAPLLADPQKGEFLLVAREAAAFGPLVFDFGGHAAEVGFEEDVHDPLVR